VIGSCSAVGAVCWDGTHSSWFLVAQQMPACREQIAQVGDERSSQSAIAHLGKAEHPLDDPDRMLDLCPHFPLGAVFRPLSSATRPASAPVLEPLSIPAGEWAECGDAAALRGEPLRPGAPAPLQRARRAVAFSGRLSERPWLTITGRSGGWTVKIELSGRRIARRLY
jgi:hypothetical protein